MPLPAESLTPDSHNEMIREMISKSIEQCMKEGGREMKQCAAMAYSMARKATGKELNMGK